MGSESPLLSFESGNIWIVSATNLRFICLLEAMLAAAKSTIN